MYPHQSKIVSAFVAFWLMLALSCLTAKAQPYPFTAVGSPTYGAVKFGNGLTTTDDNNYLSAASNPFTFAAGQAWTWEGWLGSSNAQAIQVAVSLGNGGWIGMHNGHLSISPGANVNAGTDYDSGFAINDGNKHHCVFVWDGTSVIHCYVDAMAGNVISVSYAPITGTAAIGSFTAAPGFPWRGSIDEEAVWTGAKYTAAGFALPTAPYTGSEANLHALYHLDGNGNDSKITTAAATAFTLTGPASGSPAVASSVFTVAPNGALGQPETLTLSASSAGGTFSPATLSFASGATAAQTFTYTPANSQANTSVTLTATPAPGLGTAPTASYAVGPVLVYTRVDATDPISGAAIMVLVPNSNSANPYNAANPTRLIMYFHGAGEDQQALLTDPNKVATTTAFLNAGYLLGASTGGGTNTWGNQASVDAYLGLWRYCATAYNLSKTLLWGQSMGGEASLLCLSENNIPNVVGWLGTYPVCSLANLYSLGTYAPAINTAYGITGSGNATYINLTTGHDPVLKWGWAFRRVPMQIYASYGDTVVPRAQNTDVLAALVSGSASVTVITCTGDHGDPSHFQPANYLTFVNNCFANPPATSGSGGGTKRRAQ